MKWNEMLNLYEWNIHLQHPTNFVLGVNNENPLEHHVHIQSQWEAH